jgi:receptor expression-enhancing protein 5/6
MDILNQKLRPLNPLAEKIPQLKQLAGQAGLEPGVILGGLLLVSLLVTFILFGATILTLTITVLYPAFKSIQALETEHSDDDKEWLTYWIIFGLFTLIDDFFGFVLSVIPYFYWIKLAFFIYLLAPQTQGAKFLYNGFVKDLLHKNKHHIEGLINDIKGAAGDVAGEAKRTAVNELNNPQNFVKFANVAHSAQEELRKIE